MTTTKPGSLALMLTLLATLPAGADKPAPPRPQLVVVLVLDQLRYADLVRIEPELGAAGFAGLGKVVPMRYETIGTETGAGHATLSTGAFASTHGIVGNNFYDAAAKKKRELADDPACAVWGKPGTQRGPALLMAPTVPLMVDDATYRLRPYPDSGLLRATQFAPSLAVLLRTPPPSAAFDDPALVRR